MKEIKITLFENDKITENGIGALIEIDGLEPRAVLSTRYKDPYFLFSKITSYLKETITEYNYKEYTTQI